MIDTVTVEADGSLAGAEPEAAVASRTGGLGTPSRYTVIIVAGALAWLAFARGSFSKLG